MNMTDYKKDIRVEVKGSHIYMGPVRVVYESLDDENPRERMVIISLPKDNNDFLDALEAAGRAYHYNKGLKSEHNGVFALDGDKGGLVAGKRLAGKIALPLVAESETILQISKDFNISKYNGKSFYAGIWVYVSIYCWDSFPIEDGSGRQCAIFKLEKAVKYDDGDCIYIKELEGFRYHPDFQNFNKPKESAKRAEQKPVTHPAKNLRELTERDKLEKRLKDKGATKAQETVSSLRAYHGFCEKGLYLTTRYYSADLCSELEKIYSERPSYWNTITDKGLKYYFRSPKLISPSFMSGFAAWQGIRENVDDHDVFDFFDLVNGRKLRQHPEMCDLHRRLRESNAKFGLNINEEMQKAIYAAWERYYCNK